MEGEPAAARPRRKPRTSRPAKRRPPCSMTSERWHREPRMTQPSSPSEPAPQQSLPRNVKVLGLVSLFNDTASEMIFPLLPAFLLTVLGGNRFYLGIIEGAADSIASMLKLWSGGRSDQVTHRKGFVLFGYTLATVVRPLIGVISAPWQ